MAEDIPDRHADGLDGGVAIAALRDVPAKRFGIIVVSIVDEDGRFAAFRSDAARPLRPG